MRMAISPRLAISTLSRVAPILPRCRREGSRAVAHHGERGVVEETVAGEDRGAVDAAAAVEVGETPSRLLHDDLEGRHVPRLDRRGERDLALALRHPQVRGEIPEAALDLRAIRQVEEARPV